MIDFLYGLDYDDYRSDAEEYPTTTGSDNSAPAKPIFTFGNTTKISEPSYSSHPISHNSYSLLINAKIYVIADKYDIQALKEWATTKYKEVLPTTWNSTAFIESARLIYDNTLDNDRVLRDIIIQKASENVKVLFDRGEFIDLLQAGGDFAMEVLRSVVFDSNSPQSETRGRRPMVFFGNCTVKEAKEKGPLRYSLNDDTSLS